MTATARTYAFNLGCLLCGRSTEIEKTEAEAAALRPSRCATCNGRMLLARADLGLRGGTFDPSVPTPVRTAAQRRTKAWAV